MLIPVRCFNCGKVIAAYQKMYEKMVKEGMEKKDIFLKLDIKRYCCKRMLLTYTDTIDEMLSYCDKNETKTEGRGKLTDRIITSYISR